MDRAKLENALAKMRQWRGHKLSMDGFDDVFDAAEAHATTLPKTEPMALRRLRIGLVDLDLHCIETHVFASDRCESSLCLRRAADALTALEEFCKSFRARESGSVIDVGAFVARFQ